jgi:hypothetical protein
MSLLFMLLALVGALLVLGGGSYAVRFIVARLGDRDTAVGEGPGPPEAGPAAGNLAPVGGYAPVPWPRAEGPRPDDLPPPVRARVANLVALGRTEEAVRLVRERVGADEGRARRIVGAVERDAGPGPALER